MMNKILLLSFMLLTCISCKKDVDELVMPDITGKYQINTLYNMEGERLDFPLLDNAGKIDITSELEIKNIDEYQIEIIRKGNAGGMPYTDPLGTYDIQKGEGEYIVYHNGLYIGRIDGSKLYLNFAGKSRNTMIASVRARK